MYFTPLFLVATKPRADSHTADLAPERYLRTTEEATMLHDAEPRVALCETFLHSHYGCHRLLMKKYRRGKAVAWRRVGKLTNRYWIRHVRLDLRSSATVNQIGTLKDAYKGISAAD